MGRVIFEGSTVWCTVPKQPEQPELPELPEQPEQPEQPEVHNNIHYLHSEVINVLLIIVLLLAASSYHLFLDYSAADRSKTINS